MKRTGVEISNTGDTILKQRPIGEASSQVLGESVGGPKLSPTGKEMWVGKTRRNKTVSFSDDVVEIEHQPPCLDVAYIGGEISPHNQSDLNSTLPHREMQEFVSDRPTTAVMVVETRRQK